MMKNKNKIKLIKYNSTTKRVSINARFTRFFIYYE